MNIKFRAEARETLIGRIIPVWWTERAALWAAERENLAHLEKHERV